jgi:hypothetical protein
VKRYKYIGTEEELELFGYEVNSEDCALKETDDKDENEHYIEIYIALDPNNNMESECFKYGMISFNNVYHDKKYDITNYIQDLIDEKLVEVIE